MSVHEYYAHGILSIKQSYVQPQNKDDGLRWRVSFRTDDSVLIFHQSYVSIPEEHIKENMKEMEESPNG